MQLAIFSCLFGLAMTEIIVNTASGPVKSTAALLEEVDAFLGIPFAEPPVKELRFRKPIPMKPWTSIFHANSLPPPCAQYSQGAYYFLPDVTNMTEDCLYLNIWAPKSKYAYDLRPVVIFIHGGAFAMGATSIKVYDGSKFAHRGNIIVVTINYRVGPFGYFLAYIDNAPGNMGMYDQVMAIQWVKNNAKSFGGDPENIVLMGESAGAFSISLHLVSPLSKNLFKRAILESGSGLHPLIFDNNNRLNKNSQTVASMVGCSNETSNLKTDPHSVVDCLKIQPIETIIEAEKILAKKYPLTFYPATSDDFLPKSSADLYRAGDFPKNVNVLMGVNRDEGTMFLTYGLPEYFGHYGKNNIQTISKTRAAILARAALMVQGQPYSPEIISNYMKRVKNETSLGYTQMLSDIVGDFVISCSTAFLADFLSLKGNSVYFYKLAFRAASTPMAEWTGVTHLDELQYVFGNPFHDNFTTEEIELSNRLIDRWSAFARTGNPNIASHVPWLRYSYHNRLYMNFGQDEETLRMDPLNRCEVWRKIFKADADPALIRFLRNSGLNKALEKTN